MSHDIIEKIEVSKLEDACTHHIHLPRDSTCVDERGYSIHPSTSSMWSLIRSMLREPLAEFLGTLIYVLFGTCVNCQVFLTQDHNLVSVARGDSLARNFGWAVGVAFGSWICAGISGGHMNPAITISLAVFRGFPWKKVPIYIVAQFLGALCGAAITYANYFPIINVMEGGHTIRTISVSGNLFATYPLDILSPASCFFSEFVTSAVLMIGLLAVLDKANGPPPAGLLPLSLFILVVGLDAALGLNTDTAVNPARDLGPRVLTAMVGYGRVVFDFRHQYWFWCPLLAPILGMLIGTLIYDLLIYTGDDSILNAATPDIRSGKQYLGPREQRGSSTADAHDLA